MIGLGFAYCIVNINYNDFIIQYCPIVKAFKVYLCISGPPAVIQGRMKPNHYSLLLLIGTYNDSSLNSGKLP